MRSQENQMFILKSIFWIFKNKFRLLLLSLSREMNVPRILIGSMEAFISRGIVFLFSMSLYKVPLFFCCLFSLNLRYRQTSPILTYFHARDVVSSTN